MEDLPAFAVRRTRNHYHRVRTARWDEHGAHPFFDLPDLIRYPRLRVRRGRLPPSADWPEAWVYPPLRPTMGTGIPRYDEVRCRFAGLDPVSTVGRAARAAT